jgi:putative Ca2+/H+ antiporter (TMEM165/GDT1 family)
MSESFMVSLLLVGLSEIGDKTQLAVLALGSQSKMWLSVMAGAMLAFLIADSIAVLSGEFLSKLVSHETIRVISGLLFFLLGIYYLIQREDGEEKSRKIGTPFLQTFSLVLFSEMGDKTQIAVGLLAAEYGSPLPVLAGALVSLGIITLISLFVGSQLYRFISISRLRRLAGLAFILSGIASIFF